MSLVIGDLKLKITAKYSKKHRKYEIEVNGQDYFQLPYEAPSLTSIENDEETIELIKGKITCNGKVAMNTDGTSHKKNRIDDQNDGSPWFAEDLQRMIDETIESNQLTEVIIENLKCSTVVTNELLDLMTTQDYPDSGLKNLTLVGFDMKCAPLDRNALDRLASNCPELQVLRITWMSMLNTEARQALVDMVIQIINGCNTITHLDLEHFSYWKGQEHGDQIIEALQASEIKGLVSVNARMNESWWRGENSSNMDMFLETMQRQPDLEEILFDNNKLKPEQTKKLFTYLAHSSLCHQLKKLTLWNTCDFAYDEAVQELALYLQKTEALKELVLYDMLGERPVLIELKYATEKVPGIVLEEDRGYIRIYDPPKQGEEDMAAFLYITKLEWEKLEPTDRILIYQGND